MSRRKREPLEIVSIRVSESLKERLSGIRPELIREVLENNFLYVSTAEEAHTIKQNYETAKSDFKTRHGKTIETALEEEAETERMKEAEIEKEIDAAIKLWDHFKRIWNMEYYLDESWESKMRMKGHTITFLEARERAIQKHKLVQVI